MRSTQSVDISNTTRINTTVQGTSPVKKCINIWSTQVAFGVRSPDANWDPGKRPVTTISFR